MRNFITLFIAAFMLSTLAASAQNARFTRSGVVEYEKTMNMYAIIQRSINSYNEAYIKTAFEEYKKNQPQFKKLKSTLTFGDNKTLFVPVVPENPPYRFFGEGPMAEQNNTVFNDLAAKKSVSRKKVFEETFLVKDTTRKINWKITSETREIAGYLCRRANALIMDSVYVVAFYTDEIPVSGGPESFTGLPGMILGVALPHENITWFATKVTDKTIPQNAVVPPEKGKAVTNKEFFSTLKSAVKDWGNDAQIFLKGFSL
jgi:GLPGLI family protein